MAFTRPTLLQLIARIEGDIEAHFPNADASGRRTLFGVLARMHAGVAHGLYGYLDRLAKQVLPDTSEGAFLERWASLFGITRIQAVQSTGTVQFTGTNTTVIPAGTLLQTSDGTVQYQTDADATIASGTALATIAALAGGEAGDAVSGTVLSLLTPISGINSAPTVQSPGLTGGADAETDTSLRDRVLIRLRTAPQGGAESDYIAWAQSAHPDVTDAWVFPTEDGAGTVKVRFMTYDATSNGIPSGTVVTAVQNYINTVRPVAAIVTVAAPTPKPIAMTIALSPNNSAVQTAVQAELADLFRREARPGDAVFGYGTIPLSHIREAISTAAGELDHNVVSPTANVTVTVGEIATLGTITWQTL